MLKEILKDLWFKSNYQNKKNNSGKLTIEYKNLDQLDHISKLLKNKPKN